MIRVLIVDDSSLIRDSLSASIEAYNQTTVVAGTAANGAKALDWLEYHYVDLCITDIRMPVMDGLALIGEINQRYPWVRCMVVSSYDDFQYAKMSIQLHALDYILKPVDEDLLFSALDKAKERLDEDRNRDAAQLMLRKLPHHKQMVDKWLEHIRTLHVETLPLLIVETLELLEEWVEGNFNLLNPLSNLWLSTIIEELSSERFKLELEEGNDLGLGDATLTLQAVRSYFRLCAVRRLEEGANQLVDTMRGIRDQQSVKVIDKVKQYIDQHYGEQINLQDLADLVAMNKTYMCTLFKQETEMTIGTYTVAVRMKEARNILMETSEKIYTIANQVGYEDVTYFSQLFKKHYGLSPLDYKKRMKS
ncbi:response regulator transcription factor [Paenibacillus roseipurpureus]|uniref:Response regulator n=1 Tax=Paenibacillus roseopurpureus TaxID=2918901 RepID=A0AA96LKR2_9BACL|nr:response regulator [Paenibacillus sp. MBLB1832]WNR42749.1 response regulator [Paenibacillus sp. MBLB1832]